MTEKILVAQNDVPLLDDVTEKVTNDIQRGSLVEDVEKVPIDNQRIALVMDVVKVPIVDDRIPLINKDVAKPSRASVSLQSNVSSLILRLALFFTCAISINIAVFLILLGGAMLFCPCKVGLVQSLILYDLEKWEFLGLKQLVNVQNQDLRMDIEYLMYEFSREARFVGLVIFTFALILFQISFFGCYSALMKVQRGIECFSLFCSIALIFLIITTMVGLNRSRIENSSLMASIKSYMENTNGTDDIHSSMDNNFVDFFQSRLGCCGIHNGSDYLKIRKKHQVPLSCCKMRRVPLQYLSSATFEIARECPTQATIYNSNINFGCFDKIYIYLNDLIGRIIFLLWILNLVGHINCLQSFMNWSGRKIKERNAAIGMKI